jgi:outer membrane protein TolC
LDVAQGSSEYHTTEASIPLMRQQLQQAVLRLCVLQGYVPTLRAVDQLGGGPIPEVPLALNFGVPQDLLRRRPDIRQAEQDMIRECERIGAATADLYPQLTLTGVISLDSRNLNTLFIGDSLAHSIGPSLRWNLLSFGRIKNRITAQDEKFQAAIAKYREKILLATEEALGSMVAFHEENERRLALTNATLASQQAVDLALEQYRKGLVSFQPVLETQRQLLVAEESLAASRGQVILNLIRTYKAIGGGWQCPVEYSLGNPIEMATQPMNFSPQKIDAEGNVLR